MSACKLTYRFKQWNERWSGRSRGYSEARPEIRRAKCTDRFLTSVFAPKKRAAFAEANAAHCCLLDQKGEPFQSVSGSTNRNYRLPVEREPPLTGAFVVGRTP